MIDSWEDGRGLSFRRRRRGKGSLSLFLEGFPHEVVTPFGGSSSPPPSPLWRPGSLSLSALWKRKG